jgi:cytidine deaminase
MKLTPQQLIAAAARARLGAVAPYSKFRVGAALLTRSGEVIGGANVASASYGLTCCAERVALFRALTDGYRDFLAVTVVARAPGGPMPCGACRQLLAEYAPHARVWVADSLARKQFREFTVAGLLPDAFVLKR